MQTDPPATTAPSPAPPPIPIHLVPDHRHMYLLLAGLIVGLLLSPWVLGRILGPVAYDRWYYGGGPATDNYQAFLESEEFNEEIKKMNEDLERLESIGATDVAPVELRKKIDELTRAMRKPYVDAIVEERRDHEEQYRGLMAAAILPAIVLMFLEPLFDMTGALAMVRRRLTFGRYLLLAAWLVLALAKPHMMSGTAWLVAILAIVLLLGIAAAPLLLAPAAAKADDSDQPPDDESAGS